QPGPLVWLGLDSVGEAPQGVLALGGRGPAPRLEGEPGGGDARVDVLRGPMGDLCPGLTGAGIERLKALVDGEGATADVHGVRLGWGEWSSFVCGHVSRTSVGAPRTTAWRPPWVRCIRAVSRRTSRVRSRSP